MEVGDCKGVWRGRKGVVFQSFEERSWGRSLKGNLEWVERIQQEGCFQDRKWYKGEVLEE